jgi:hypothetical protein
MSQGLINGTLNPSQKKWMDGSIKRMDKWMKID